VKREISAKAKNVPVPLPPAPEHVEDAANTKEDSIEPMEVEKVIEEVPLTLESCIFCTTVSSSFEENLKHMTNTHSFFVPDIEFIQDLEGLVGFLQSKVSEDYFCLLCNGKGRGFGRLDAVRKHMVDKGHCMIDSSEQGCDEIAEFYDFSTSYPDWEDVER
jgi:pre-60S factor REI1